MLRDGLCSPTAGWGMVRGVIRGRQTTLGLLTGRWIALVPSVIASAENVVALRAWIVQCALVPLRTLVGRVGKRSVPLHLEHVYRLRSCAASWTAWIRGMYQIIEAMWTVHELRADIVVAALQMPDQAAEGPWRSDESPDSDECEQPDVLDTHFYKQVTGE